MIPFEMYLFKYGVILGILDLLKLLGKKIYVCIYIYIPQMMVYHGLLNP